jgi:hypothetical protein
LIQLNVSVVDRISHSDIAAAPGGSMGKRKRRTGSDFSKVRPDKAGSRLNMYDDSHQSREARTNDEAQEFSKFNGERTNPPAPLYTGAACCPDGAARRIMDDLLRECLRRKSLTP